MLDTTRFNEAELVRQIEQTRQQLKNQNLSEKQRSHLLVYLLGLLHKKPAGK
jgi:hypothetical protein